MLGVSLCPTILQEPGLQTLGADSGTSGVGGSPVSHFAVGTWS